ncbi:restriction endonuclease subunit S, partial [Bacteroides sp.]|uniref:restriction endonuclease subunit S n=1 Tax=Bacteroides sp. TaxID=29523 RepID=UPI0023BB5130
MVKWKECRLGDLIEEIAMGPFGSNIKVECFVDKGVPVLNGSNLQGFRLNEVTFNYVTHEKADSLGRANAFKGDVVITHRGTLGQIIYIPEDSKYERYVISQSQFRVRFKKEIDPQFIVYFFHTRVGQHLL